MENIQTERYWAIVKETGEEGLSHRIYNRNGQHFTSPEKVEEFLRSGHQIDFDSAVGIYELDTSRVYAYPLESNDAIINMEVDEYVESQKDLSHPIDTNSMRFLFKLHDQGGVIQPEYVMGFGRTIDPLLQSVAQGLEERGLIKSLPISHGKKFEIIASVKNQLDLK